MQIINLNDENKHLYFMCLEDWSDEMKETGNHKEIWYNKMKDKGLRVKFAADDNGVIGGMIHYLPIENSFAEGKDLYFINCIWVHGYKKGRGNFQKQGMGKALLKAAEEDVRQLGAKGLAAWGVALPFWMKASWFKKHGYKKVENMGGQVLLWKPFTEDALPPSWIKPKKDMDLGLNSGEVVLTLFKNGWCPAQNLTYERAKYIAEEFPDKVEFREINTFNKEVVREWGISDAFYINDKLVRTGPPPSYKKIRKLVARRVKKIS